MDTPPGMSQVQAWLRSLRLHKYGPIFTTLSYDRMMSLSDEELERRGVTRGARNKILINIRKLHGRKQMLIDLDLDLERDSSATNLRSVLNDLKGIVITPMKPHDELSYYFLSVLKKVYTSLMKKPETIDREVGSSFRWLTDRILGGESFSNDEKLHVKNWRQGIGRAISASRMSSPFPPYLRQTTCVPPLISNTNFNVNNSMLSMSAQRAFPMTQSQVIRNNQMRNLRYLAPVNSLIVPTAKPDAQFTNDVYSLKQWSARKQTLNYVPVTTNLIDFDSDSDLCTTSPMANVQWTAMATAWSISSSTSPSPPSSETSENLDSLESLCMSVVENAIGF